LGAVSHDLRTPLTAIKTSAATLREPGLVLTEGTRKQLLANIEADADRLIRFVGDALALNRLEAGFMPRREWNAVGEVASATLDRFAIALGERSVTFDVPDDLPLMRFDPVLLDQALGNLIDNVVTHTPPRTSLVVAARVEGSELRMIVADDGPGIPVEARARVFERFERIGTDGEGAGLGLTIARAAVEAQGGTLSSEDNPGGGARFVLVLPTLSDGQRSV